MEPTVNGSTEEAEGTPAIVSRDQPELGPSRPGRGGFQDTTILSQTTVKLDDEEDEGVAQNSSIENGESIQFSSETDKQGRSRGNPTNQEETKDMKPKGTEELLNGAHGEIISAPVVQNRKLSLKEVSEVRGDSNPKKQSPDRPAGGAEVSEEERRKKSYEAEVKSWLLERMQAPIEGRNYKPKIKPIIRSVVFN